MNYILYDSTFVTSRIKYVSRQHVIRISGSQISLNSHCGSFFSLSDKTSRKKKKSEAHFLKQMFTLLPVERILRFRCVLRSLNGMGYFSE